ncbi:MAG: hypothetical protein R3A80_04970 [Bdellovibrionota bacterium]
MWFHATTLLLLLSPLNLQASWKCRKLLNDEEPFIRLARSTTDDGFWIPETAHRESFQRFKEALPVELRNAAELADLAAYSPLLKRALTTFVNSLDPNSFLGPESDSIHVVNHLMKSLFNEDFPKTEAAQKIASFLRETQLRALSRITPTELQISSPDKKLHLWATEVDNELRTRWYDTANDETVYSWLTADSDPKIEALLWGNREKEAGIFLPADANIARVEKALADKRRAPLLNAGEVLRDHFRILLENFENGPLHLLNEKYKRMYASKDAGAMDNVNKLLSPYQVAPKDGDLVNVYFSKSLEVIQRLLNSAQFFEDFVAFKDSYIEAADTLLDLSRDPKLTQLERQKLSDIASERLISASVDLVSIGLNYSHPHEYRYRSHLLEMQHLNGQLEKEVIPLGHILNFGGEQKPPSIIIAP